MRNLLVFTKARISLLAGFSAATGYLLSPGRSSGDLFLLFAGVVILAGGSSALNQWQEWRTDALMERTRNRPIPRKAYSPDHGFLVAAVFLLLGISLVQIVSAGAATALGALAVLWYNGVYTPLKRVTAFAAVPGGLVGAIPPAIGFVTGGGALGDPRILGVAAVLFIWQIPHFWLLLLRFGPDYEQAGFPTLTQALGENGVKRVTVTWLFATVAFMFALPLFGVVPAGYLLVSVSPVAIWLLVRAWKLLRETEEMSAKLGGQAFHAINLLLLVLMGSLSLSRWLS
ncbi:MAG: protoheme IX farnesyltransferase [Deltaproteobacteria bacterium]|nr:protoheme IX farnesyltransferase [Deltaproteobacteria bacterium]